MSREHSRSYDLRRLLLKESLSKLQALVVF